MILTHLTEENFEEALKFYQCGGLSAVEELWWIDEEQLAEFKSYLAWNAAEEVAVETIPEKAPNKPAKSFLDAPRYHPSAPSKTDKEALFQEECLARYKNKVVTELVEVNESEFLSEHTDDEPPTPPKKKFTPKIVKEDKSSNTEWKTPSTFNFSNCKKIINTSKYVTPIVKNEGRVFNANKSERCFKETNRLLAKYVVGGKRRALPSYAVKCCIYVIMAQHSLTSDIEINGVKGFQIPTTKIAEGASAAFGIEVNPTDAHRALQILCDIGEITMTDATWQKGKKARTFSAKKGSITFNLIKGFHCDRPMKNGKPKKFIDGQTYSVRLALTLRWAFEGRSQDYVEQQIMQIEGWDENRRLEESVSMFNNAVEKIEKSQIVRKYA